MPGLGTAGPRDVTLAGDGVLPGRERPQPAAERIAARVEEFMAVDEQVARPNVQLLNEGFFALERMRVQGGAKKRSQQREQVEGK